MRFVAGFVAVGFVIVAFTIVVLRVPESHVSRLSRMFCASVLRVPFAEAVAKSSSLSDAPARSIAVCAAIRCAKLFQSYAIYSMCSED